MIKTIGELKKAIANIDNDFTIDVRIVRELSEEELSDSNYPYPYEYTKANLEIGDIGYSDKDVFINIEEISDDVCEYKIKDKVIYASCNNKQIASAFCWFNECGDYKYCPYCGKKIKVVEQMDEEDFCYCHYHDDTYEYFDCLDYMECEECPYYYADEDQEVE